MGKLVAVVVVVWCGMGIAKDTVKSLTGGMDKVSQCLKVK